MSLPFSGPLAILALLLLIFTLSSCADPPERPSDSRPNVLLVTVDTLRPDYLGVYGFDYATSPHMDALAAEGVVFERALAAASATAPSHASILTSLYTRQHSIGPNNTNAELTDEQSVAERFREAGFATAAFISNYVLRGRTGLGRGFDLYDDEVHTEETNRPGYYERIAEATNIRALAWLAETDDAPVFLWVHYQDPHGPYAAPGDFKGRFSLTPEEDEVPLRVNSTISGFRGVPNYQALDDVSLPSEYRSRYADEIFYADRAIGALIEAVESLRNRRELVVLLTSDHGESLGEGEYYFSHGFATTPQLARVPMILKAPGIPVGRRSDLVHHVDVMPTLLELAGLEIPAGLSGVALGPYLRDARPLEPRTLYCDIGSELSAYRGDSFVRLSGVAKAWKRDADAREVEPVWIAFDWSVDGSWAPSNDPLDEALREPIRRYMSSPKPIAWTDLSPHDIEQLRALGYLD